MFPSCFPSSLFTSFWSKVPMFCVKPRKELGGSVTCPPKYSPSISKLTWLHPSPLPGDEKTFLPYWRAGRCHHMETSLTVSIPRSSRQYCTATPHGCSDSAADSMTSSPWGFGHFQTFIKPVLILSSFRIPMGGHSALLLPAHAPPTPPHAILF